MARLVEFSQDMEREVRFVEDTDPGQIIQATIDKLRAGDAPNTLMTAAALAVSRSCELPPDHHGGPIHPIAGIHATHHLAGRLDGEWGFVPVIQSVVLANKHIHSPDMGPTVMAAIEPAEDSGDVDAMLDAFATALMKRQSRQAERLLAALIKTARPGQILNAMLAVGLRQNSLDDHFFLYPLYAIRALDDIGWEWAETVLRPPVRYLSRHPMVEQLPGFSSDFVAGGIALYRRFGELEALFDEFGLTEDRVALTASGDESEAIAALAETIGRVTDVTSIGRLVAEGLGGGLSLDGAGEALSIGGAMLFLRSRSGNPFDVHIHTGINARRYLLGLDGISFRNKILGLLTWSWGNEVRFINDVIDWPVGCDVEATELGQDDLLAAIEASITSQPVVHAFESDVTVDALELTEAAREPMALAQQYAEAGFDPVPYFAMIGRLTCHDDVSEMHAYKMQQAAFEEYNATCERYRWMHMVSAAKHAACVVEMIPKEVYPEVRARLDA
jgi:hypothetical protein